jgi:hypothetical protein
MRWAGSVKCTGKGEVYRLLWESLTERYHVEDLDVDKIIILKRIFKKQDRGLYRTDLARVRNRWWGLL